MNIADKLNGMKGKLYLFNKESEERVIRSAFNEESGMITIETDVEIHRVSLTDSHQYLSLFEPLEGVARVMKKELTTVSKTNVTLLKDTLFDSINKIKENKDYIPQAQAINDQVKSLIDLAKAEIEAVKVLHQLKS